MRGFLIGFISGCVIAGGTVWAQDAMRAWVNTNGVLYGYVVQKDGVTVCSDPAVWNELRGPTSYIVCD